MLCRCHSSSPRQNLHTHNNLLKQGVTLPRLPHQGAGVQFTGTADHVSFPVSQVATAQGGQTGGAGEGHSTRLGDQGQG